MGFGGVVAVFLIGMVVGIAVLVVGVCIMASGEESRKEEEKNPCQTCARWWECNGVDQDNCPLWENAR